MPKYLALLRAINVGGNNKIKMAELKAMFESEGHKSVSTYIQSGNVIFKSRKKNIEKLEQDISKAIYKTFGHDIAVILRTYVELNDIATKHPFDSEDEARHKLLYTFFLKEEPTEELVNKLKEKIKEWPEQFEVIGKQAYLFAVNGYGSTKLSGSFVERQLKIKMTARNRKSVNTLLELMND
ncbi:MAG: DUF1697 domain-containing protein [Saprospiraceae bacterium]